AYIVMKILKEARLPDGVVNFIPGSGSKVGDPALSSPQLAGIHFTGSTATLQHMWKTVGTNIAKYKSYPRIVGETGGKDFVFVHESADEYEVATALSRGTFEFQGQKCSAVSRAYIPEEKWPKIKEILLKQTGQIRMGDPEDFTNFMSAVIDKAAFDKIKGYIDYAKNSADYEILTGGDCDDSKGYFIEATIVLTKEPDAKLMEEEIFGPVLTVYLYKSRDFEETLKLCDKTSPYALTGAIFAKDRDAIELASDILRHAAGNFYINDKPTGAVVGQQPFGGARASGTNDKAGSYLNLLRWISVRTIKENFLPPKDFKYPFMEEA
ncbi:MAG: aldehyde dehydrogenase family protein, partial [Proteobacteria bacterium]|nr:aldehyde dehydrogenase family protein [Pseudomonadota bacterium]